LVFYHQKLMVLWCKAWEQFLHIKIRPESCHFRENGNPVFMSFFWIPAYAGMTDYWITFYF
jgi:hypothetical protein